MQDNETKDKKDLSPYDKAAELFSALYMRTELPPNFEYLEGDDGWALQDPEGVYTWTGTQERASELAWTRFSAWTGHTKQTWCLLRASKTIISGQASAMARMTKEMEEIAADVVLSKRPETAVMH
jgi:hypothetical protein